MITREELILEYRKSCQADEKGRGCCCPACCAYCLEDVFTARTKRSEKDDDKHD